MKDKDMKDNKNINIEGSGGGKGGGSGRAPVEAPNTLQSRSTAKVVSLLSEGEIVGLVGEPDNPLKGIYFDNTPVQSDDGTFNFPGVYVETREGLPSQTPLAGFTTIEDFTLINTIVEDTPGVVGTLQPTSTAARVIVRLPAGLSKLNPDNGDLNGYYLGVAVDARSGTTGSWTEVFSKTITGKAIRAYEEAYRIERPSGSGVWQVRVRRTTQFADETRTSDTLSFWALGDLIDMEIPYNDAAIVGLAVDSEATGGQIPRQSFLVDGIKILVPDTYIPTEYDSSGNVVSYASYAGDTWNGVGMTEKFSDDPAWVCYNLLVNPRWGLGMDPSQVDHWSFYEASRYNMALIPSQHNSSVEEPRFTFNGILTVRDDPYKVLQAVASNCRAVIYGTPNLVRIIQDRPSDPIATINANSVVDGKFNYSSSSREDRLTSVNVTFNDMKDNYLPKVVNEQASLQAISRFGYNQVEIAAVGVVKESQARRLAKWALDTALNAKDIVQFDTAWRNSFLDVGDVFTLVDDDVMDVQGNGDVIMEDETHLLLSNHSEESLGGHLFIVGPTGEYIERDIIDTEDGVAELDEPLPENWPDNTSYVLMGSSHSDRQYKVISIEEGPDGGLSITASRYDPTKYDRVEQGIIIGDSPFNPIVDNEIAAPTNLQFHTEAVVTPNNTVRFRLRITWDDVDDPYLSHYILRWRRNAGQFNLSQNLTQGQYIIEDALPGYYEVILNASNTRNTMSPPLQGAHILDLDAATSPLGPVFDLELEDGGYEFNKPFFNAVWEEPEEQSDVVLKDYVVRLYDEEDFVMKIFIADTEFQQVTREDVMTAAGGIAIRNIKMGVAARDNLNQISADEIVQTFTNPAPAVLDHNNFVVEALLGAYKVTHDEPPEEDWEGVKIWQSTTQGFTPGSSTLAKDDVGTSHLVEANENSTYYFRVAAYDDWSKHVSGLNLSEEVDVDTEYEVIPNFPTPGIPQNVTASSNIFTLNTGSQVANIFVTWDRITGENLVYDVEILKGGSLYSTVVVSQPSTGSVVSYQINGEIGIEYCFRVRSRNGPSTSDWSTQSCVTQVADNAAPAIPTNLSTLGIYQGAHVTWDNPSSSNLGSVEVWRRTGTSGTGEMVADVPRPLNFFFDDGLTIGTNYGYRIRSKSVAGVVSFYTSWSQVTPLNVPVGSIGTTNISESAITTPLLAANSVVTGHIASGSITSPLIAAGAVTADSVGTNTIISNTANIGTAVITAAQFQETISSDNYIPGTQGWAINRNLGTAEFGNVVARGSIVTGTTGQRVEVTEGSDGYLLWAGGPGDKTDANGVFWVKSDGSAFINASHFGIPTATSGGAGGADNTGTLGNRELIIGPFYAQEDANINLDVGWLWSANATVSGACPIGTNSSSFTVVVERSFDYEDLFPDPTPTPTPSGWEPTWTQVDSRTVTAVESSKFYESEFDQCFIFHQGSASYKVFDTNDDDPPRWYRIRYSSYSPYGLLDNASANNFSLVFNMTTG